MDFEVTNKSTAISSFICYVMSSGGDSYRTRVTRDGGGTHSIIFTTPNRSLTSLYLRINADVTTAGTEYTVDNFVVHKYTDPIETVQFTTDFSSAVKSGVNVSSDGIVFQPNSGSNGLSVSGTTDRRLLVTNTTADESKVRAELELEGGHQYVLRYEVGQDIAEKRVLLDLSYRVGTTWNLSETRGLFTTGSGVQMVNFFLPSDANAVRVSLARSAGSNAYDGVGTPYTIDNFSISKLEVSATRTTTICEDVEEDGQIVLGGYRYGFNGKEMDNEVSGAGNQYDYGFRIYNPRIGRFLSTDPLYKSYPQLTPYQFSSNSPIANIDLDGLEATNYWAAIKAAVNGVEVLKMNNVEDVVDVQFQQYRLVVKNPTKDVAELYSKVVTDIGSIYNTDYGKFKFEKQTNRNSISTGDYIRIDPSQIGLADIFVKVVSANLTKDGNGKTTGFDYQFRTLEGHAEVGSISFSAKMIKSESGDSYLHFMIESSSQIDPAVGQMISGLTENIRNQQMDNWSQTMGNILGAVGGEKLESSVYYETYENGVLNKDYKPVKSNQFKIGEPVKDPKEIGERKLPATAPTGNN